MKNIKLTLATLTILAMSFSGSALAKDWNSSKNYKHHKNSVISKKAARKNITVVVPQKSTRYVKSNNTKTYVKVAKNKNLVKVSTKASNQRYAIRSGDTLYRISLRTGISVNKLTKLNRLSKKDVQNLKIGQILRLV